MRRQSRLLAALKRFAGLLILKAVGGDAWYRRVTGGDQRRNRWGLTKTEVDRLRRERCEDPAQWHRWHKVNSKRRRQLRAMKQRGGLRIDPLTADIPRYLVP